jgi:hypothetical protein
VGDQRGLMKGFRNNLAEIPLIERLRDTWS